MSLLLNNVLEAIGAVKCADCGGNHPIMKDTRGLLVSTDRCPGNTIKSIAKNQLTDLVDAVQHVEECVAELKARIDESDWTQVQALADEMNIKLGTIFQIAVEVEES
jgi:hypothetical protein